MSKMRAVVLPSTIPIATTSMLGLWPVYVYLKVYEYRYIAGLLSSSFFFYFSRARWLEVLLEFGAERRLQAAMDDGR